MVGEFLLILVTTDMKMKLGLEARTRPTLNWHIVQVKRIMTFIKIIHGPENVLMTISTHC